MDRPAIDFAAVGVLTFDCYGTLIDWERGILEALGEVLARNSPGGPGDDELLEAYASEEARLEAGPWRPYRTILQAGLGAVCQRYGHDDLERAQLERFGDCVTRWPPFADSAQALATLSQRFELGVMTNCDDDLFQASNVQLGQPFSWMVTAQQVEAYKPSIRHFEAASDRIGNRRESWIHVAQSLYHDHAPAQALGIRTVWINRRHGRSGSGATPRAQATPDLEFADMATFADFAAGKGWLRR